jgi:hypothetical protein
MSKGSEAYPRKPSFDEWNVKGLLLDRDWVFE